jgi:hypothetical protein
MPIMKKNQLQKVSRKRFLELFTCLVFCVVFNTGKALGQQVQARDAFPSTIQFSPPGPLATGDPIELQKQHQSIDDIRKDGFSDFWIYNISGDTTKNLLNFAQSHGMAIDYMTSGFEGFDRDHPSVTSVYSPQYRAGLIQRVEAGLAPIQGIRRIATVFPFQDEPFHAGPESFDYSDDARAVFRKRYGYSMPLSAESARKDPKKWLDLLNFQSNTFRDGWIQLYHVVKAFDPRPKIVMTHDSHNSFGAGVKSNSRIAIDDVFHWGGNFADILAYDIYPYMTFDYRYGEPGKFPKPRISQMHYTISQLRNVTATYGKGLGFWVGTYSEKWFSRFRGPERKNEYWSEREMSYTAIAQGADFLISPSNYNTNNLPLDTLHWKDYAAAMKVIQKEGAGLLKAPKVKAKACFLFPRTQYLQLQEEYYNVGLTFELFLRAFGEMDILHEEQITDDRLNGYKVLVLADVKLLPEKVARHIASFVQKGGIVISDCVPRMDAFKQPLHVMTNLFGVSHSATGRIEQEGQWVPFTALAPKMSFPPDTDEKIRPVHFDSLHSKAFGNSYRFRVVSPRASQVTTGTTALTMNSGTAALITRKVGKGKTYLFGFCIQDTYFRTWKNHDLKGREDLRSLVSAVFHDAGVRSHIYSSNPDIEASVRANKKQGYIFIINHESSEPQTTVRLADLDFPVGKITDVESGHSIPFTASGGLIDFKIKSLFGTTRLLKVTSVRKP